MGSLTDLVVSWYPGLRNKICEIHVVFDNAKLGLLVLRVKHSGLNTTTIVVPRCMPNELDLEALVRSSLQLGELYDVNSFKTDDIFETHNLRNRIIYYIANFDVDRVVIVRNRDDLLSLLCLAYIYCLYCARVRKASEVRVREEFPFKKLLLVFAGGDIDLWYARGLALSDGTEDRFFGSTDVLTLECVLLGFGLGRLYFARFDSQHVGLKPQINVYVSDEVSTQLVWIWREKLLQGDAPELPDDELECVKLLAGLLDGDGRICLYRKRDGRAFLVVRISFKHDSPKGVAVARILESLATRGLIMLGSYSRSERTIRTCSRALRLMLDLGYPLRRDKRIALETGLRMR